jgi:hypothetical protein
MKSDALVLVEVDTGSMRIFGSKSSLGWGSGHRRLPSAGSCRRHYSDFSCSTHVPKPLSLEIVHHSLELDQTSNFYGNEKPRDRIHQWRGAR